MNKNQEEKNLYGTKFYSKLKLAKVEKKANHGC